MSKKKIIETQSGKVLCAAYVRLSQEDGSREESNSITNQKTLIRSYIDSHPELELVEIYADDGYSGVSFDRPDFQRMISDMQSKRFSCIIVKDLSRFGRNYVEVGSYLEHLFPFYKVRFIAINDGIDTAKGLSDADQLIIPFKNLFNDNYSRDISMKVRSGLDTKRKSGAFVGSTPIYGYIKDPNDHNKLIIDEDAAKVVRQIFAWRIEGLSCGKIAIILNERGVLCPLEYKKSRGVTVCTNFRSGTKAQWSHTSVRRLLENDIYLGHLTQGKSTTLSYKLQKSKLKPQSEWDRVENTHEAIVTADAFEAVQELTKRDTRISPNEEKLYLFSGYLFCADCHMGMIHRNRNINGKSYGYYACGGYRRKSGCTSHNISEKLLYDTVLRTVQYQCQLILSLGNLYDAILEEPEARAFLSDYDVQIEKKLEEIKTDRNKKTRLLETFADGVITKQEYAELSAIYEQRIHDGEKALSELQRLKEEAETDFYQTDWKSTFLKYQNIKALDRMLMAELISRIEVTEDKQVIVTFKFADQIKRVQDRLAAYAKAKEQENPDGQKKP